MIPRWHRVRRRRSRAPTRSPVSPGARRPAARPVERGIRQITQVGRVDRVVAERQERGVDRVGDVGNDVEAAEIPISASSPSSVRRWASGTPPRSWNVSLRPAEVVAHREAQGSGAVGGPARRRWFCLALIELLPDRARREVVRDSVAVAVHGLGERACPASTGAGSAARVLVADGDQVVHRVVGELPDLGDAQVADRRFPAPRRRSIDVRQPVDAAVVPSRMLPAASKTISRESPCGAVPLAPFETIGVHCAPRRPRMRRRGRSSRCSWWPRSRWPVSGDRVRELEVARRVDDVRVRPVSQQREVLEDLPVGVEVSVGVARRIHRDPRRPPIPER